MDLGQGLTQIPLKSPQFATLLRRWLDEARGGTAAKGAVDRAVQTLAARVQTLDAAPAEGEIFGMHEADNATRVERYVAGRALHSELRGWVTLNNGVWEPDQKRIVRFAEEALRKILEEADQCLDDDAAKAIRLWGLRSLSKTSIDHAISLASSRESLSVDDEALDRDPYLVGVAQGVLDLRTGSLVDDPARCLVTRRIPVSWDPMARAPRFRTFLSEVFSDDQDLIDFVQRWLGYCLTGSVQEQVLCVFHGPKAHNGKSTLLDLMLELFGDDYAHAANHDILSDERAKGTHNTDRNQMRGRRLSVLDEWPRGAGFDETAIKKVTGGKKQSGRGIQEDESNFRATAKVIIGSNYVIEISGENRGVWRRVKIIPFLRSFDPTTNPTLWANLVAELPGILAWVVEGTREWYRRSEADRAQGKGRSGLDVPPVVDEYTNRIRGDLDDVGRWAEERLIFDAACSATPTEIAASWAAWCDENKIPAKAASRISSRTVRAVVEQRWGNQRVGGDGRRLMGIGVLSAIQRPGSGDGRRRSQIETGSAADIDSLMRKS